MKLRNLRQNLTTTWSKTKKLVILIVFTEIKNFTWFNFHCMCTSNRITSFMCLPCCRLTTNLFKSTKWTFDISITVNRAHFIKISLLLY